MAKRKKSAQDNTVPQLETLARRIAERWQSSKLALSIERIASEFSDVSRYEIVAALRALEKAGHGTLLSSPAGQKPKFLWTNVEPKLSVTNRSVDNVARSVPDEVKSIADASGEVTSRPAVLEHHFHLRTGFVVKLVLPADISRTEAERLCRFVQAIPFEPEASP